MEHYFSNTRSRNQGFTLIELLVVIAIIAILAAILFPVFARARENARRASCASNLKQLAIGWQMYAQDYDGRLPFYQYGSGSTNTNVGKVYPYVKSKQIFLCPSSNLPDTRRYDPATSAFGTDYGMPAVSAPLMAAIVNSGGSVNQGDITIMDAIPEPSITCLMAETNNVDSTGKVLTTGYDRFPAGSFNYYGWGGVPELSRHFDGSNYAFMDGHVKWLKKEAVLIPHASNSAIKFYW